MIGVVNPNATETLDLQEQYAFNATTQLAPGDPFPSETLGPTNTPSATGAAAGGTDNNNHGLGAGAIGGIGVAAGLILVGALVLLCGRRGGLDMAYRRGTQTVPRPMVNEANDNPHNPKSRGRETYSTVHCSIPLVIDPYWATSPHTHNSSPSPVTPSHPAYSAYSPTGGYPNVQSPPMAGTADGTQDYQ